MTAQPDPLATSLPGGLVLVGPEGARRLLWAMRAAEQVTRRDGIAPPADYVTLRQVIEAAVWEIQSAASGRSEVPPPADLASSRASSSSFLATWVDPVGTSEAAAILGCGTRNVRDLCERGVFETAGVRASQWWVERAEVARRAQGSRAA